MVGKTKIQKLEYVSIICKPNTWQSTQKLHKKKEEYNYGRSKSVLMTLPLDNIIVQQNKPWDEYHNSLWLQNHPESGFVTDWLNIKTAEEFE